MSKCKKIKYRKCGRKRRKKSCKRNYITRTTCCKGGSIPSIQDALTSTTFPGYGAYEPHRHSPHGYGAYEPHLHVDSRGRVFVDNHLGGDQPHNHNSGGQDYYVGRVLDPRSLRDPDLLNVDVLGPSSTKGCGTHADCRSGEYCERGQCLQAGDCREGAPCAIGFSCKGGYCLPKDDDGTRNATRPSNLGCHGQGATRSTLSSTYKPIGRNRTHNGYLVGGFGDPAGSSHRFTSASLVDGSTTSHHNLVYAAPGPGSTLPPEYLNTGQKTVDLRLFNNDGFSIITPPLSGSKRPTVCKSKIKEVYYC